jgi:hypothetical protein
MLLSFLVETLTLWRKVTLLLTMTHIFIKQAWTKVKAGGIISEDFMGEAL